MLGLGCMRLSTDADRDDARGLAVLVDALDAGITLLDTADAYCHDETDVGHNKRLIARALAARAERSPPAGQHVVVVTKGGLVRPGGAWVPDGRARHLDGAARASRERLGVDALDLYLLHVVDPKTPFATSVRALAKLRDAGVARAIGLSNVGVHQLEQALAITAIDAVEIELSPWKLDAVRGGLVAACAARGIRVLAYRPLGGRAGVKRLARDAIVNELAQRAGVTGAELVLAWLRRLAPVVIPIPGATRVETARSAARVMILDDAIATALDAHFLAIGDAEPHRAVTVDREVVLIAGMPAAGKSTLAAEYAARGYTRLNRDERGGTLLELAKALDRELAAGATRVVLDNTYGTRASRAPVIAIGKRHGVPVRCIVYATSLEQAQHNAVARMLAQHGRLLEPGELGKAGAIGPSAQFRYRRSYEPPRDDEGFGSIEETLFERVPTAGEHHALIVELDDLVWIKRPRDAASVALAPGIRDRLVAWQRAGYLLAGTTWQTPAAVDARMLELLDLRLAILRCPHPAGPPVCWCRKPMPGLALAFAHGRSIDLSRSVHVGRGPADRGFALRAGLRYFDVADGFPEPGD